MTAPPRPYDRATRMGDSDYPGALRPVGEGWRVSVSPDGRRYRLQPLISGPDGDVWGTSPAWVGMTLAALLARCSVVVPGLAQACEGLPDDPSLACPDLTAQRQVLLAGFAAERVKAAAAKNERRRAFFRDQNEKRAACCWPSGGGRAAVAVCGSFCGLLAALDAPGLVSGASRRW